MSYSIARHIQDNLLLVLNEDMKGIREFIDLTPKTDDAGNTVLVLAFIETNEDPEDPELKLPPTEKSRLILENSLRSIEISEDEYAEEITVQIIGGEYLAIFNFCK